MQDHAMSDEKLPYWRLWTRQGKTFDRIYSTMTYDLWKTLSFQHRHTIHFSDSKQSRDLEDRGV